MSDNKQLNKNHRWIWKLVMDTFKAHKDINETPLPKFAHVIAGDIARPVAERITELQAEVERLQSPFRKAELKAMEDLEGFRASAKHAELIGRVKAAEALEQEVERLRRNDELQMNRAIAAERKLERLELTLNDISRAAIIYVRDSYPPEPKHDRARFEALRNALIAGGYANQVNGRR